jgi:hypothetical protein
MLDRGMAAVREALAHREREFARSSLAPEASARIHRALSDHARRSPRPSPGVVLVAALVLAGLMPWNTGQCQAPQVLHGRAARAALSQPAGPSAERTSED